MTGVFFILVIDVNLFPWEMLHLIYKPLVVVFHKDQYRVHYCSYYMLMILNAVLNFWIFIYLLMTLIYFISIKV